MIKISEEEIEKMLEAFYHRVPDIAEQKLGKQIVALERTLQKTFTEEQEALYETLEYHKMLEETATELKLAKFIIKQILAEYLS